MCKKSLRVEPIVKSNPKTWEETKTSSKVMVYTNVKTQILHLYILIFFFISYTIESQAHKNDNKLVCCLSLSKQENKQICE